MAGSSLFMLIDDIATLLDDVSIMTKVAAKKTAGVLGDDLVQGILTASQRDEAGIYEQRERVTALKQKLQGVDSSAARSTMPCDQ